MSDPIDEVFAAVPRQNFLPDNVAGSAALDAPLPIGFGQTNSQPSTVARMLEWLEVEPGHKILDVGSGSGWSSALLARLAGGRGTVHAVEVIPELLAFGQANCERLDIQNVRFHHAGKHFGWPPAAPYDRILVSAAAAEMPSELFEQLKPGGRMVVPVQSTIYIIDKDEAGNIEQREQPGFMFVSLVRGEG